MIRPVVFFDGDCAFCQWSVRWIAERDRGQFTFAPLGGATFLKALPDEVRQAIPDAIVVLAGDGTLLMKGRAVRYLLARATPPWPLLGALLGVLPRIVLDAGYDFVARHRRIGPSVCEVPTASLAHRVLP